MHAGYISKEIDPATGIERLIPVSAAYIASRHLMMLWTDLGFLDLFDFDPADPTLPVDGLFERSVTDDEGFRYASRDDLRRMKLASGRTKDMLDIEALDEITPPPPHP